MVRILAIILIGFESLQVDAQGIDAFVTASASKKQVVVEQPLKIKITAYSATWFAEPLSIGNLQVSGAFVQSFKRTQSGIKYINNKKYASLDFYYILFPYNDGELIFPELEISTSIPPEGDYKGRPVTKKTKPITIQVDPVPDNADVDRWLVATNARISDRWSQDLSALKVGDVVTRTITIRASGTLPTFIDAADIGEPSFASIYTSEPEFRDERDNVNANGRRVDTYSYLLEQQGSFTVPPVKVTWWNPYAGRYYSRELPSYELIIEENPQMLSLNQLRDSLNALNQPAILEEEPAESTVDYQNLAKQAALVILIILVLSIIIRLGIRLWKNFQQRRKQYLGSEPYWFRKVMKQKQAQGFINNMYHWMDVAQFDVEDPTLEGLAGSKLEIEWEHLQQSLFSSQPGASADLGIIKQELKGWRAKMLRKPKVVERSKLIELNP